MNKLEATVKMKCPRCHEGDIFESKNPFAWGKMTTMHTNCPNCNLKYEREPGFFYGAMYVSSIFNMILFVMFVVAYYLFFVGKVDWRWYIISYVALTLILFSVFYRISRSLWLQVFSK